MQAKYSGKCARTGQSYKAGTEITKGAKGWEIARDTPQIRVLMHGAKSPVHLQRDGDSVISGKRPGICGQCVRPLIAAKQYDESRAVETDYHPEFQLRIEGEKIICPTCGERGVLLTPENEKQSREEAARLAWETDKTKIHLVDAGYGLLGLSHRVPAEVWEKIKVTIP